MTQPAIRCPIPPASIDPHPLLSRASTSPGRANPSSGERATGAAVRLRDSGGLHALLILLRPRRIDACRYLHLRLPIHLSPWAPPFNFLCAVVAACWPYLEQLPSASIENNPPRPAAPHPNLAAKEKAEATRVSPSLHLVAAATARLSGNLGARRPASSRGRARQRDTRRATFPPPHMQASVPSFRFALSPRVWCLIYCL
jgi:hypothetical protein